MPIGLHRRRGAAAALLTLLLAAGIGPRCAQAAPKEESVRRWVATLRANPADNAAREALRRLFTEEYPVRLPHDVLEYLPIPYRACADAFPGERALQRSFFTTGLAFPDAAHRSDPEGHLYNRVLYAYAQEEEGEWSLCFRVLYNHRDEGAEALAPRTTRALLAVRAAHVAMLGLTSPVLSRPLDAWLRPDGDGGAGQSGVNLFFLGTAAHRDPVELLRQAAHEFGHAALPPVGPLQSPEEWGNGFLGEALYLRWLSRASAGSDPPAPPEELGAYVRHQIDPLARAFAITGWNGLAGQEKSVGGLRLLLGMVLNLEDKRGPGAVAGLFRNVRGGTLPEWIAAAPAE
ncbi:MAG: hypothetical protein QHJ73_04810 [Armatimonadota bacterium]|nr:hypothetical protein [Armatimonadota bacterium]